MTQSFEGHSWRSSLRLFQHLRRSGWQADEFTSGALVNICGVSDEWERSLYFLKLFHGCSSQAQEAEVFAQSKANTRSTASSLADAVTVNAAMSACEGRSSWEYSISLLSTIPQQRLDTEMFALNSGISALSWSYSGEWQKALAFLDLIALQKLDPTDVTWNALATVAHKTAQWQFCCWLLDQMAELDQLPDVLALEAAVLACERSGANYMPLLEALARVESVFCIGCIK